jgi:tRNA(Met) C34 N-acetyltransferase TmcA
MERFKLHIEAESRIRWKVYVRFGGEFSETDYSNMARRWLLSLHYKFDDLSTIAYNTLLHNMDKYKVKPHFYVINFDDPHRSHRCNPINPEFMTDISDAYEASYTIMLNLNKTWV